MPCYYKRKSKQDKKKKRAVYRKSHKYTKYKRCVRKLKKRKGIKSPYAVCRAALYKKKRRR